MRSFQGSSTSGFVQLAAQLTRKVQAHRRGSLCNESSGRRGISALERQYEQDVAQRRREGLVWKVREEDGVEIWKVSAGRDHARTKWC